MEEQNRLVYNSESNTRKAHTSLWDNLSSEKKAFKPKVIFELNKPVIAEFQVDKPTELLSKENDVFCLFDVTVGEEQKVIMTSAYTLLIGLKKHEPLLGKKFMITKRMEGNQQKFEVVNLSNIDTLK